MEEFTQKDIVALMNKLIADDYMVTTDDKFPVVRLRPKSYDVLKGKETVSIKVSKIEKKVKADNELFEILKQLRKNNISRGVCTTIYDIPRCYFKRA